MIYFVTSKRSLKIGIIFMYVRAHDDILGCYKN